MINNYRNAFSTIGIDLSDSQFEKLCFYSNTLKEWNKFMNLTAIDDDEAILWRHFIDSCQILKYIQFTEKQRIADIGTGAGFPGLPLAIITGSQFSLMDSLNKRVQFLNHVIESISLSNVDTYHGRAEDLGHLQVHREQYDFVVSRAVSRLSTLLECTIPFLKVGGYLIAYKANQINQELTEANRAMKELNCKIHEIIEYSDINNIKRNFVVIKKVSKTADKYPRKAGTPQKKPL